MIRKIIKIDEEKCNGCRACAEACHEGAIGMVDGKAKLLRDDYCDGLGDCLPVCPTGAISFEEREAAAYDEQAVKANMAESASCQCPGMQSMTIPTTHTQKAIVESAPVSQLRQWPIQIKLAPISAPYYQNSNILISADCAAYAYGDFHNKFIKNRVTLIGCPKLDAVDYSEKLAQIIKNNDIKSVTAVRMQVPCCGGIEQAVKTALQNSGKMIPWQVVTLTNDGNILD